jgi:hypothetical protein
MAELFTGIFRLGCEVDGGRQSGGDIPRKKLLDAIDRMVRNLA